MLFRSLVSASNQTLQKAVDVTIATTEFLPHLGVDSGRLVVGVDAPVPPLVSSINKSNLVFKQREIDDTQVTQSEKSVAVSVLFV